MRRTLAVLVGLGLLVAAALWRPGLRGDDDAQPMAAPDPADPALVERGAYLARAGNCQGCHTPLGAPRYSGGRGIPTPFGTVYSSNLTPDVATGIGAWSAADFRRALHQGRSRDGRLLYPAFPYDAFTRVSAADADALWAFLRGVPAVEQPNRPHALRFPYDTPLALALWRALYFSPGRFVDDPRQPAEWNRGAYLVQGLGHCAACHAQRNALGATRDAARLAGGLMPLQNWLAPALGGQSAQAVARLLRDGIDERSALLGPMAEVVLHSTQHLSAADRLAIGRYLQSLAPPAAPAPAETVASPAQLQHGAKVYEAHCARCHGADGRGAAGAYLPLAGSRAVQQTPPANLVQVVLGGAFAPSTAGNPRPFGMPPFALELGDEDIAAVLSYIRSAWGNRAGAVQPLEVQRWRSSVRP
jgi:mono/diheme cytochrome c family protein